jgi:cell division protein FtsI/penicillin-binding protein 2
MTIPHPVTAPRPHRRAELPDPGPRRLSVLAAVVAIGLLGIASRLVVLQLVEGKVYAALALSRPGLDQSLEPDRGRIFLSDPQSPTGTFPVAVNRTLYVVYASPKDIVDPKAAAKLLAAALSLPEAELAEKLLRVDDPYVPIAKDVPEGVAAKARATGIRGIGFTRSPHRSYPERHLVSHVVGFLGATADGAKVGRYGIEGHWEKELVGTPGHLSMAADDDRGFAPPEDGADVVLTIDRAIQYATCEKLAAAVTAHKATGGSAIVLDPKTGAVLAMCGVPDFDPNAFGATADVGVFNNPATFAAYEPGSVFKPFTMAAAIDAGAISPTTTYEDEGKVKIGPFTIRNSDGAAHGLQTMTQVLEKSLNTGTIFAQRAVGPEGFRRYVQAFGFGRETGIELDTESAGNVSSLDKKGDIWPATASYGQGITTTPLQLAAGYGALANGGTLLRPYVVGEVRYPDGHVVKTRPAVVREAVSPRTASLVTGMLVRVVESGHGKKAAVPGYFVAGKTGTAQIARKDGQGYEEEFTIGSFAGFVPATDPRFVLVVRIDRPDGAKYAETTAAPVFGEIAAFLVNYLGIPAERK